MWRMDGRTDRQMDNLNVANTWLCKPCWRRVKKLKMVLVIVVVVVVIVAVAAAAAVEWIIYCISGSAAAIAIVSATPVGKWENPSMSLGTTGMDPSIAVVVPSVSEKSELQDSTVDVPEPLVLATSSMLGSPAVDNKLRLTSSTESASPAVAIAKVISDSFSALLQFCFCDIFMPPPNIVWPEAQWFCPVRACILPSVRLCMWLSVLRGDCQYYSQSVSCKDLPRTLLVATQATWVWLRLYCLVTFCFYVPCKNKHEKVKSCRVTWPIGWHRAPISVSSARHQLYTVTPRIQC